MITKKKLKTRFDYQVRTFGFAIVLVFLFTFLTINPEIEVIKDSNLETINQIQEEESLNSLLKEEFEFNTSKITISND